jgi:hypothetical protein
MPLARLHRPEQVKGISHEAFHYAFARAFDWAALPAEAVPAGWLLDSSSDEYIVLIAASFYGAELLDDEIDDKSESVMFLLGRLETVDWVTHL